MKFRKLDDKTLCCLLSEQDLTEKGITLEDFLHNRDKVQDFLEDIIETAKEEVGFEASGPMLSIQIMASHPNGIMITFSSEEVEDIATLLKAGLSQMKGGGEGEIKNLLQSYNRQPQETTAPVIFRFPTMEAVFACADQIAVRGLQSSLYKNEKTGWYYLVLSKKRISEERYYAILTSAMEFGEFVGTNDLIYAKINEYFTCILKEKAVNTLKKIGITS